MYCTRVHVSWLAIIIIMPIYMYIHVHVCLYTCTCTMPLHTFFICCMYMYIYMYTRNSLSHGIYSVWDMYRARAVCTSEGGAQGSTCTYSTRAVHIPCTVKNMRQLSCTIDRVRLPREDCDLATSSRRLRGTL